MLRLSNFRVILLVFGALGCQQEMVQNDIEAGERGVDGFGLVAGGVVVDLMVDGDDSKTVLLATRLFSEDIERVCGQKAII